MTFSAEDFAKALEAHDYDFQVGSTVRGTVISFASDGATVDIGGKSAAFLPIREAAVRAVSSLEGVLEPGAEYSFQVIRDQDADGQLLLSIRKLQLKQLWDKLAEQAEESAVLDVKVTGYNKGGVTVDVEGLRGFVPRSHLGRTYENLEDAVGQRLTVGFLEVNPGANKLVMSARLAARSQVMSTLALGQLIEGTVASLKPFGAFIEFDGISGLLHIKQISKNYVESLPAVLKVGQPIKAVVVALDPDRNRISLSTKVLEKYPGELLKESEAVFEDAENRLGDISRMLGDSEA
ncbi:S1 RNA-binding domain-containing protein [Nodosilinea sp. LEGE 07298]|uniref:S1 RNA-binding domain-containing protein n=1 Tax=Nodosilinea sp. LEGE 07298 TaxID=2777970 RepID=UPI00187F7349|nr:S1 RNA-binding domain-containing protein [Nodosilinea sp. LEGE 07298]MBE9111478.1 S1 RNA-binding domain-containing protein [Nodosilinea sp. LEGE 07298]